MSPRAKQHARSRVDGHHGTECTAPFARIDISPESGCYASVPSCTLGSAAMFSARAGRPVTLLTHEMTPALRLEARAVTTPHLVVPAFGQLQQNLLQAARTRTITAARGSW